MPEAHLDAVIHVPTRLRIVTYLDATLPVVDDEVSFPTVQRALDLTAGNLTTHLTRLEEAGYIAIAKAFAGRKPVTYIRLTAAGRTAFQAYRTTLLAMIGGG
jgi:DNA-binding MarR family transcriptional regulator